MYTYTVNVQCLVLNSPYTCKFPKAYGDTMTDISTTGTKDHNVTQSYHTLYVVGYEKRDHIAQKAIFCCSSACHHTKAIRAPGFPLGLQTV